MSGPSRYCSACYRANAWEATACAACGTDLLVADDDYDDRLIWALDHPDTATAMTAADVLARRHAVRAIPALLRAVDSDDPYRAQAGARALAAFEDDPRVAAALPRLRHHRNALVRRELAERAAAGAGGPAAGRLAGSDEPGSTGRDDEPAPGGRAGRSLGPAGPGTEV